MITPFEQVDIFLKKNSDSQYITPDWPNMASARDMANVILYDQENYEELCIYQAEEENTEIIKQFYMSGDIDGLVRFNEIHHKKMPPSVVEKFKTIFLLEHLGQQALAQKVYGEIEIEMMKEHVYPEMWRRLETHVYKRRKSKESSKPRHRLYEEAMDIAAATWRFYQRLSMNQLIEMLMIHFTGEKKNEKRICEKTLNNWLKKSEIRPKEKPIATTGAVLIIPEKWKKRMEIAAK